MPCAMSGRGEGGERREEGGGGREERGGRRGGGEGGETICGNVRYPLTYMQGCGVEHCLRSGVYQTRHSV